MHAFHPRATLYQLDEISEGPVSSSRFLVHRRPDELSYLNDIILDIFRILWGICNYFVPQVQQCARHILATLKSNAHTGCRENNDSLKKYIYIYFGEYRVEYRVVLSLVH